MYQSCLFFFLISCSFSSSSPFCEPMNFNHQECMKGFISEHGQLSGGYTTEENSMTLWNIHDVSFQCLPLFIVYVSLSIKYPPSQLKVKIHMGF